MCSIRAISLQYFNIYSRFFRRGLSSTRQKHYSRRLGPMFKRLFISFPKSSTIILDSLVVWANKITVEITIPAITAAVIPLTMKPISNFLQGDLVTDLKKESYAYFQNVHVYGSIKLPCNIAIVSDLGQLC